MKTRILFLVLLSSIVALSGARAADDHEHTPLGEHMEKMGGAFRRLGRQVADPAKNAQSLELLATMRTEAQAAVKFEPEKTADLPAGERAKFVAAYQKGMEDLLVKFDALQAALKSGDNAAAAEQVKALKALVEDSHKQFRKKKS